MPPFARLFLPICLAAACQVAFAGGSDVQLKPSPKLSTPMAKVQNLEGPTFLEADFVQGHIDRAVEAGGHVVIHNLRERVEGDWLRYDQSTDEAEAKGAVVFMQ